MDESFINLFIIFNIKKNDKIFEFYNNTENSFINYESNYYLSWVRNKKIEKNELDEFKSLDKKFKYFIFWNDNGILLIFQTQININNEGFKIILKELEKLIKDKNLIIEGEINFENVKVFEKDFVSLINNKELINSVLDKSKYNKIKPKELLIDSRDLKILLKNNSNIEESNKSKKFKKMIIFGLIFILLLIFGIFMFFLSIKN